MGYQGCQVVFKLIESFYDDANFCNAAMLLLLIIVVLMIVMLLIIVAEESGLLEDANLIFVHFGTLALFRKYSKTKKCINLQQNSKRGQYFAFSLQTSTPT